jgi:hypothetical protein
MSTPSRPSASRLPPLMWVYVIANAYIDFNKLFDSHFSIDGDRKCSVQRFGDCQLVPESLKVDRQVRTHGDWTVAWNKYKKAVLYLYPHWRFEIAQYERHIQNTFVAIPGGPEWVIAETGSPGNRAGGASAGWPIIRGL